MKNLKKIRFSHIYMFVLTIALIFLSCQVYWLNEKEYRRSVQSSIDYLENAQSIKRLEFCVNHAIKDCTEENVAAWNEKHPEDAFNGKSHLDISRQSVESVRQVGY
jgi:hypothetical protein